MSMSNSGGPGKTWFRIQQAVAAGIDPDAARSVLEDEAARQVTVNAGALAELIKYANEQAKGWASEFTAHPAEEHDPELKAIVARLVP